MYMYIQNKIVRSDEFLQSVVTDANLTLNPDYQ
jgi:hypothetical protein